MKQLIWDGDAHIANIHFGENYGVDWAYIDATLTDIVVNDKVIIVGDEI
jgi:hypothetical protein